MRSIWAVFAKWARSAVMDDDEPEEEELLIWWSLLE
jgi:hypothetical protein